MPIAAAAAALMARVCLRVAGPTANVVPMNIANTQALDHGVQAQQDNAAPLVQVMSNVV